MARHDHARAVPAQVWLACALLALLRAIPYLLTRLAKSTAGFERIPVGYNPSDWLSYVAFIRQHDLLMINPFVSEPQEGRFVLLFHTLLGKLSLFTGLDPFLILELSRVPLIFVFFLVLWRFLVPILPEFRHRVLACWLVAFSGGVEYLYLAASGLLPVDIVAAIASASSHLRGWSTFSAFYNPLWIAALTMSLVVLKPILQPTSPTARDKLAVGLGTVALWFTHPYSAIEVIAVYFMVPLLGLCLRQPTWPGNSVALATPLALAVLTATGVSLWQLQDPTFKASSSGALGSQDLSVFWYPLVLGALLIFVIRGWQQWISDAHPWRIAIAAWTLAVIGLHSSPVLNGYHFVMYLHIPICIVATVAVAATFDRLRATGDGHIRSAGLVTAIFASSALVTLQSAREAHAQSQAPGDLIRVANFLATEPSGNVLAPPDLGNVIPAYTDNRVFTGQWFLTPDFEARNKYYWSLVQQPAEHANDLQSLLLHQRIRYLVVPTKFGPGLRTALRGMVIREVALGSLIVLVLPARPLGSRGGLTDAATSPQLAQIPASDRDAPNPKAT